LKHPAKNLKKTDSFFKRQIRKNLKISDFQKRSEKIRNNLKKSEKSENFRFSEKI